MLKKILYLPKGDPEKQSGPDEPSAKPDVVEFYHDISQRRKSKDFLIEPQSDDELYAEIYNPFQTIIPPSDFDFPLIQNSESPSEILTDFEVTDSVVTSETPVMTSVSVTPVMTSATPVMTPVTSGMTLVTSEMTSVTSGMTPVTSEMTSVTQNLEAKGGQDYEIVSTFM